MFEKFFGGKKVEGKNSTEPAISGVAHFDGSKTEKDFPREDTDFLQDDFDNKKIKEDVSLKMQKDINRNNLDVNTISKVGNERHHSKLGEKNSGLEDKNLVEDPNFLNSEDQNENHLNANAEINHAFEDGHEQYDKGDYEKAA